MDKIVYILAFVFMTLQHSQAASPTCSYQPGMGHALGVLSQLDTIYRSSPHRDGIALYANNLIQTGLYPGPFPPISDIYVKPVTGGINSKRTANSAETCVMSKEIIRSAVLTDKEDKYRTIDHYRQALESSFKSATHSPRIHRHLLIALITVELAIAKKMQQDTARAAAVRQQQITAALAHNQMVTEREARRAQRRAQRQAKSQGRKRQHHGHGHGHGGHRGKRGPMPVRVAVPPPIPVPDLMQIVISQYSVWNGSNDFGSMAGWIHVLQIIGNSHAFNEAFDIVAKEHRW